MSEQDPQMFVAGGQRGRGRPRSAEPGSTLSIWVTASQHDLYSKLASARGESLSKTVGLLLKMKVGNIQP